MGSLHNINVRAMVEQLKDSQMDFEWYPTTREMLSIVKDSLRRDFRIEADQDLTCSILDIGAGDGSALTFLTSGDRFAIEKSRPLIEAMDPSIATIGSDFHEQTLIDKVTDAVWCNPPYSEFEEWVVKIINEANTKYVYLALPVRWEDSEAIDKAITNRKAEKTIIGSGTFRNAERAARCEIHIVRLALVENGFLPEDRTQKVDPFQLWFDESFGTCTQPRTRDEAKEAFEAARIKREAKEEERKELIHSSGLVDALYKLYQHEMQELLGTYKALTAINESLLNEVGIHLEAVQKGLRNKIEGLKNRYWKELFNNLDTVTSKLTEKSRNAFLDALFAKTCVDFSPQNAHNILVWVIKNANLYYDMQLMNLVDTMAEAANVKLYKSNQRTFKKCEWRYSKTPEWLTHYKLELRIILTGSNATKPEFLEDILTIANNLGYDTSSTVRPKNGEWQYGVPKSFTYFNHTKGETLELMQVKMFMKGTYHIKFNQEFLLRLNVEFGRLSGWLYSAQEAHDELDIPIADAQEHFGKNLKIAVNPNNLLEKMSE
ncbi:conserved hypothetical protein [Vibrio nigripulchritudo SOn1]|uniref:DUF4942 domain-containing protein n=1 Tax=Vibrio nigripulchritudo SOn1 TaxID=1238450 RepID=A0AAV2VHN4_9VIBR|nr:DUF4942 domain-containing protein [Vibrio nigripulchritudo]CCO44210.1 conserved hypothetical protein [Vibrio nigripulchritudo SOn1]